jgi:uncharacterized membrane protein
MAAEQRGLAGSASCCGVGACRCTGTIARGTPWTRTGRITRRTTTSTHYDGAAEPKTGVGVGSCGGGGGEVEAEVGGGWGGGGGGGGLGATYVQGARVWQLLELTLRSLPTTRRCENVVEGARMMRWQRW